MRVTLDEKAITPAKPTLAEALRSAIEAAQAQGRIIIEVHADGAPLSDELLAAPEAHQGSIGELRLVSAEPRTLVRVTLLDAADVMEQTLKDQRAVADLLQTGEADQALARLGGIFATWQAVCDVVSKSSSLLGGQWEQLAVEAQEGGKPKVLEAHLRALREDLRRIRQNVEDRDWSALADTLTEEFGHQAGQWRHILTQLAKQVQAMPPL